METTPIDFDKIKTYPIRKRKHKVKVRDFAKVSAKGGLFSEFFNSLPNILVGKEFAELVEKIVEAYRRKRAVIFCLGGHIIKCGLSPLIIELMKRKVISAIAMNGATALHDFEIAMIGETSENVARNLLNGSFGMVEETGRLMNEALTEAVERGVGAGQAFGDKIVREHFRYKEFSILAEATQLRIPVTVHIAIGTDTVHQHPQANGAAIGEATFKDFQMFSAIVKNLNDGGVLINFGSAVVLPEVFLKALTIARNVGYDVKNFTSANFDMICQYRPYQNVVTRPVSDGGKGYNFVGHHELMVPLLVRSILEKL